MPETDCAPIAPEDVEAEALCFDSEVTKLFDQYADDLYRFVRKRLGHEDAEEVVQDAFLATRRQWRRVRLYGKPISYVYKAARNIQADVLARNSLHRSHVVVNHEILSTVVEPRRDDYAAIDEWLWLHGIMERLSPRQQEVILLSCCSDLPHQAIAARLSISVGTVKSTLFEARAALRPVMRK